MSKKLRVLIVEDSEDDAQLLLRELRRGGYTPTFLRVDTPEAMNAALDEQIWDVVLADYVMPRFSAPAALMLLKGRGLDLPFIVVSGAINEETAVSAMKAGAHDYVMKEKLARLIPAIERELGEARERGKRQQAEKALEDSEARYQDLFNSTSDAIFVRRLDGSIIGVNRAAVILTGYTSEELLRMNIAQFLTPESLEIAMQRQQKLIENVQADISQRYELQLIRKDGTRRTVDSVASLSAGGGRPSVIQAVVRDITEQHRSREDMRIYAELVTNAQEEERKRIARELHDETAQNLASLELDIDLLISTRKGIPEDITDNLERLREKIDHTLQGVRRFGQDLRPSVLEDFGLLMALEWLSDELASQSAFSSSVEVLGSPRRLSPHTELVLFRIAQEALNNVRRHSQGATAAVRVDFGQGETTLTVTDNGRGFEVPEALGDFARRGRLGIVGMYERADLINGKFSVQSKAGKGTTVTVVVKE